MKTTFFLVVIAATAGSFMHAVPGDGSSNVPECRAAVTEGQSTEGIASLHHRVDSASVSEDLLLERCYGELGCFSIGGEFMDLKRRPIQLLPQSREKVNTRFHLFTREKSVNGHEIRAHDDGQFQRSGYRQDRAVKFIVHGFMHSPAELWAYHMRRDLLIYQDLNVIMVDWSDGAGLPYTQAVANTRLVGAEISLLIRYLKKKVPGFRFADVHLIGHSLGAQICGYAGKYFPSDKLGRISAVGCSHMRAVHLFTASILSDCPFTAFRCKDYSTYKTGRCFDCSEEGACISAGMKTVKPRGLNNNAPNVYFMDTGPKPPYCGYHYGVRLLFCASSKAHTGRFNVELVTGEGKSHRAEPIPGDDEYAKVLPGDSLGSIAFSKQHLGDIVSLEFEWTRKYSILEPSSWLGNGVVRVSQIVVFDVLNKTSRRFCSDAELKTKMVHTFTRCQE